MPAHDARREGSASAGAVGAPDPLASIDWGTQLATDTVAIAFVPEGEPFGQYLYEWTPYEKRQALLALEQVSNVTDLTFRETADLRTADFILALTDLGEDLAGQMYPPGETWAGFGTFDPFAYGWDDERPGRGGLEQGGVGFSVLLHEFGHGLGLAHPHDDGGSSSVWVGVRDAFDSFGLGGLNQGVSTTMSYNFGWPAGSLGPQYLQPNFGFQGTMMALDLAVLQEKYGANATYADGDDVYRLPDANKTGTYYSCIWDTGGTDRIVYNGDRACVIDLRAASLLGEEGGGGWVSFADGVHGGFTIANGVRIEVALGGSGMDYLRGNDGANTLSGRLGADLLIGGHGGDILQGGIGSDVLRGGHGSDVLLGGRGADLLRGGVGDDVLKGGGSADIFSFAFQGGDDRIVDFEDGIDLISVRSGAERYRDLALAEVDGDAMIAFADVSIRLEGVGPDLVDRDDFLFG